MTVIINNPTTKCEKCKPVRKKKQELYTVSFKLRPNVLNSFICKEMNVHASTKLIAANEIHEEEDVSKQRNVPPRHTAALESNKVLANVNSQGSGE
jgi:hypothetical protein